MKPRTVKPIATFALLVWSSAASGAAIEKACLSSERGAGQRGLCNCIQDAADKTLSKKDQKLAATFFGNPQRAQDIRQSGRRNHEVFWERYKNFGEVAETFCKR